MSTVAFVILSIPLLALFVNRSLSKFHKIFFIVLLEIESVMDVTQEIGSSRNNFHEEMVKFEQVRNDEFFALRLCA